MRRLAAVAAAAATVALGAVLLPGGGESEPVSLFANSYGVGNDGFGVVFEMGRTLGYGSERFTGAPESLPEGPGRALFALAPGAGLLAPGQASAERLADWVRAGNTLVVAFGDGRLDGVVEGPAAGESADPGDALSGAGTPEDLLRAFGLELGLVPAPTVEPLDAPDPAPGANPAAVLRALGRAGTGDEPPRAVDAPCPLGLTRVSRATRTFDGDWAAVGVALVAVEHQPVVLRVPWGRGRVVWVSDAGVLTNRAMEHADNAWLAAQLLHPARGDHPILFEEWSHGFGSAPGLASVLVRPPAAFASLNALVLLAALAARRSPRFGRPLEDAPPDRRDRAEHVEAVAEMLRRGRHGGAVAVRLRDAFICSCREALRQPALAPEDLAAAVAARVGADPDEVRRLLVAPPGPAGASESALLRYALDTHALERKLRDARIRPRPVP